MGCACSRAKVDEKTEQLICDSDSCSFVAAKKEDRWNYSGEIAVTPARAGASKVVVSLCFRYAFLLISPLHPKLCLILWEVV